MSLLKIPEVSYIVVEGLDAAGKDSGVEYVRELLVRAGKHPIVIYHGYDSPMGRYIISGVKRGDVPVNEEIFMLFSLWSEILINLKIRITDLLSEPDNHIEAKDIVVIFNRYVDSTYVYQCVMKDGDVSLFDTLEKSLRSLFTPDYTILMSCSQEVQRARIEKRHSVDDVVDHSEVRSLSNHRTMSYAYITRYDKYNPGKIISTDGSIEETKESIKNALAEKLGYVF